jgi:hypothetical protein
MPAMPQLLDLRVQQPVREDQEYLARRDLRRQIARLERDLGVLHASHDGVPSAGGPRVLDMEALERVRDSLVDRVHIARDDLAARAHAQERSRELLQRMLAAPQHYRWMRISREHLGEPGCGHWHSRPVLGPIGMLMGWWRVKVSSGCP